MKRLTEKEIETLYDYLSTSIALKDIYLQILVETGCRIGEALMLTASSISHEGLTIKPLKNSNKRSVIISENLRTKLKAFDNPMWRRNLGPGNRESHCRSIRRHFYDLSLELLGRRINLHALRHTAFSRLYVATKDILLVKHWAGHKSINSTLVYVHLEKTKEANEAYQALLIKKSG